MDTLDNLRRKIAGAEQLKSVVRTMKALAASNIGQFEMAVTSLKDYYRTVMLGIAAYLRKENIDMLGKTPERSFRNKTTCVIVFGSDQGLVGQFNESLLRFVSNSIPELRDKKEIWSVGDRIQLSLANIGLMSSKHFYVPSSVNAITPLIGQMLTRIEKGIEEENINEIFIFYNQPKSRSSYIPISKRLLPLDEKWRAEIAQHSWPTRTIPEIVTLKTTVKAFLREYFFVSLFRACAESLASENASRLNAMQRAEKNIEELLQDLGHQYHQMRQTSIDEELFDVVSGFEAMKMR